MSRKLGLALCLLFTLSACGGDSGDTTPPGDSPPPAGDDENDDHTANGNNTGSPDENGTDANGNGSHGVDPWLEHHFDTEDQATLWAYTCQFGCSATLNLDWDDSNEALVITPHWAAATDELYVYVALEDTTDFDGDSAYMRIYAPADYAGTAAQLVLTNVENQMGMIGWQLLEAGWNHFYIEAPQVGTGYDGDTGDFGWHSEGFTLQNIQYVGLQITANSAVVDNDSSLKIDTLQLSEGVYSSSDDWINFRFPHEDQVDQWTAGCVGECDTTATLSWDEARRTMAVNPQWASTTETLELTTTFEPIPSLVGKHLQLRFYIPEDYPLLSASVLLTDVHGHVTGFDGIVPAPSNEPGWFSIHRRFNDHHQQEQKLFFPNQNSEEYFDFTEVSELSLRVGLAMGQQAPPEDVPFHIDDVIISTGPLVLDYNPMDERHDWYLPPADLGTYVDMTQGWRASPLSADWEYSSNGVTLKPSAVGERLMVTVDGPLDPQSVMFGVSMDQAFIDSPAYIHPVMYDNAGNPLEGCRAWPPEYPDHKMVFACYVSPDDNLNFVQGESFDVGLEVRSIGGVPAGQLTIEALFFPTNF